MSAKPAFAEDLRTVQNTVQNNDVLPTEVEPVVLRFAPILRRLQGDDFFRFCQLNEQWKFELSKEGDLIVMMPSGGETGRRNAKLSRLLGNWAEEDGTGECFDSSTGFILPNGAERSPDAAWISKDRWAALSNKQQEQFVPLCPDFVIELRSRTDRLKPLQAKMTEYLENGAQLGWLIDPYKHKVYIYRPNQLVECLESPSELNGENILPGFVLSVARLWQN
jgi:Uma2 family endonuclease